MSAKPSADMKLRWSTYVGDDATAGDMSATITGSPTCVAGLERVNYQFYWPATGSPVGTISFAESNDHDPTTTGTPTNGTWVDVDSTLINGLSSCHPAAAAGSHMITISTKVFGGKFIRPKITYTSGSGTVSCWVHGS